MAAGAQTQMISEVTRAAVLLSFTEADADVHREYGVIDKPESQRLSHYFRVSLPRQVDAVTHAAVIHNDRTRALIPLEPTAPWRRGEMPETYSSALRLSGRPIPKTTTTLRSSHAAGRSCCLGISRHRTYEPAARNY